MSSAEIAAGTVRELDRHEIRALNLLGHHLERFEIYPRELLAERTTWSKPYMEDVMFSLQQKKLITTTQQPYRGYILREAGLDALVLNVLATRDMVTHMGRRIGVGKESDIFEGLGPNREKVSLKFFRIGRVSFSDVVRKRGYGPDGSGASWFVRSIAAAGREFEALRALYAQDVSVPEPIAREGHVVVMEFLDGEIVAEAREVLNPELVLDEAIAIVEDAYGEGYVNGDLSAFNLFVTRDERVLIIDWPQWMNKRENEAKEKLKEDLSNLVTWFERKYDIERDVEEVFEALVEQG